MNMAHASVSIGCRDIMFFLTPTILIFHSITLLVVCATPELATLPILDFGKLGTDCLYFI
jgi:hypothetical protein